MSSIVLQQEVTAPLHDSKKTCKDMESSGIQLVMVSSIKWWEGRRPVGWTLEKHLEHPCVNQVTGPESELAQAVADWIITRRAEVIGK